jgi:hypothetical protein
MSVLPRYWPAGAARASIARDTSTPLPFAIIGRSVQRDVWAALPLLNLSADANSGSTETMST